MRPAKRPPLRGSVTVHGDIVTPGARPLGRRAVTVLDTRAWIWWVSDPDSLCRPARRQTSRASRIGVPVSAASRWRSVSVAVGSASIGRRSSGCRTPLRRVELLQLTPAIAVKAADLPSPFPGDLPIAWLPHTRGALRPPS